MASLGSILIYWLISLLISLAALPLAHRIFSFLPDKGLGFSRLLGMLLAAYLAFLIGFVHNSPLSSVLAILAVAGISFWLARGRWAELKAWLGEHIGLALVYESLFLFLLLLWGYVRMHHPNIVDQEKFMDFAFFNAVTRSPSMPPFDPWLAGVKNYINYYYFGYFAHAHFARLSGLDPAICYNLSVAMVFALAGQAIFSIGYNTTRTLWPGFVGLGLLSIFGNLHGGLQVITNKGLGGFDWWAPTRLIKDVFKPAEKGAQYVNHWWHSADAAVLRTNGLSEANAREALISEFPNFSFIHGDLHPHFNAIPFLILALGLGLNLVMSRKTDPLNVFEASEERKSRLGSLAVLGLALGALFMTNTWDVPAFGLVISLLLLIQQHQGGRLNKASWLKSWLLPSLALVAALLIFALPFKLNFSLPFKGIGIAKAKTGLHDTLVFWGGFLIVIVPFLILRARLWGQALAGELNLGKAVSSSSSTRSRKCAECGARLRQDKLFCAQCGHKNSEQESVGALASAPFSIDASGTPSALVGVLRFMAAPARGLGQGASKIALIIGLVVLAALLVFYPSSALMLAIALLAGILLASRQDQPEANFSLALIAVAALAVLSVEWLFVRDVFEGNLSLTRMNSIFKFYFQAWVLLAAAAPFAIYWTFQAMMRVLGEIPRTAYFVTLGLIFACALAYPVLAIKTVWGNFGRDSNLTPTLDGSAWLKRDYPGDHDMILTLRDKVKGKAVIAEAVGGAYTRFARVSSFTGLAAVVGWGNHESQWRQTWPQEQEKDVNRLYETLDASEAQGLIKKYNVNYVFAGSLERSKYSPDQLNKFRSFMDVAFDNGKGTTVYKSR